MKIVCYGASVTAQKNSGGYYSYLESYFASKPEIELSRLSFGASHFDFAGFGYARLLLDKQPDIAIIDWLTPSMKRFTLEKIIKLNNALIEKNCLPIWVNFPRKDDLNCQRECYSQVRTVAHESGAIFFDLIEVLDIEKIRSEYLRDIVHTTEFGARAYAKELIQHIEKIDHSKIELKILPLVDPIILFKQYKIECTIEKSKELKLVVTNSETVNGEFLLNTRIGPNSCLLELSIYDEKNNEIGTKMVNPTDAWCHYSRNMILPTLKLGVLKPGYSVVLKHGGDEALDISILKGEIKEPLETEKFLHIFDISCNVDLEIVQNAN